jgi:hypothetical protein
LVHLSHLKVLGFSCEFVFWSKVFVAMVVFAFDFVFLFLVVYGGDGGG